MFAIVIMGVIFGMFALSAIGAIAFLDAAMRPAPQDPEPNLVSYARGQETRSVTHSQMPKSHVA